MSVSEEYRDFILSQLEGLGDLKSRRMFGGAGIWCDGLFIALLADDTAYFKVDDTNRPDYEEEGMDPFTYQRNNRTQHLQFYEIPPDILEDPEALLLCAEKSLTVARNKQT